MQSIFKTRHHRVESIHSYNSQYYSLLFWTRHTIFWTQHPRVEGIHSYNSLLQKLLVQKLCFCSIFVPRHFIVSDAGYGWRGMQRRGSGSLQAGAPR